MPFLGWGGSSREVTIVNDETERLIPLRTFWNCVGVSALDVLLLIFCLFMASRQIYNLNHPLRTYGHSWWPSAWRTLLTWWPSIVILICLSTIAWSLPLFYRFYIESVGKNAQPQAKPWNPENGMWTPFVNRQRRRIERAGLRNTYREKFGKGEK